MTVVGVMPQSFLDPDAADHSRSYEVWAPLVLDRNPERRRSDQLTVIGRLRSNTSPDQARADMSLIGVRLRQRYPEFNAGYEVGFSRLQDELVGNVRRPLLVMLGAVGFLLLIACSNVAHLVVSRTLARQREFAIRASLGAGMVRLLQQLI